jgi:hypothetical protein
VKVNRLCNGQRRRTPLEIIVKVISSPVKL